MALDEESSGRKCKGPKQENDWCVRRTAQPRGQRGWSRERRVVRDNGRAMAGRCKEKERQAGRQAITSS